MLILTILWLRTEIVLYQELRIVFHLTFFQNFHHIPFYRYNLTITQYQLYDSFILYESREVLNL